MKLRLPPLSPRERGLLGMILLVGVLWWGSALLGRYSEVLGERSRINRLIDQGELELGFAPEIRERLASALSSLDPGSFLNANQFRERADQIAREAKVLPTIGKVNSRENQGVSLHRLSLEVRSLRIADLIRIEELLRLQAPYLQIESIFVNGRRAGAQLSAEFVLSAFEVDDVILQQ